MKLIRISFVCSLIVLAACEQMDLQVASESGWNHKYDYIYAIPSITFHYDHGILAGSYEPGHETTQVRFNDVCSFLGHVCLCGAGGYKISQLAENKLREDGAFLEKGEFSLISSRDHTVSDAIAYVFGCVRRNDPEKNQYFIDDKIEATKREYHYYLGYHPERRAVHIVYRKHLLIGNDQMDRLWQIELAFENNPEGVGPSDIKLYQGKMADMVSEVLGGQKEGLFEVELIDYDGFKTHLDNLKSKEL